MTKRILVLAAALALAVTACAADSEPTSGPSEGIAVHGDWTIDVYDPDGTLVDSTEFSNALTQNGAATLSELLAGTRVVDRDSWRIGLYGCQPGPTCPAVLIPDAEVAVGTGPNGWPLIVTASDVAPDAGTIEWVATSFGWCNGSVSADSCAGAGTTATNFTSKNLDPSDQVTVAAGQTVQVTVEITFTTG